MMPHQKLILHLHRSRFIFRATEELGRVASYGAYVEALLSVPKGKW
jgi:hypothetical protein